MNVFGKLYRWLKNWKDKFGVIEIKSRFLERVKIPNGPFDNARHMTGLRDGRTDDADQVQRAVTLFAGAEQIVQCSNVHELKWSKQFFTSNQWSKTLSSFIMNKWCIPSKEHKVIRQFFRRRCVREYSQSLWPTHETQGSATSIARSHMPLLFTAFSLRLFSAGGQKCDFCKPHSRRECKVVHSFWVVKVWQSGVRYRHWPIFFSFSLKYSFS